MVHVSSAISNSSTTILLYTHFFVMNVVSVLLYVSVVTLTTTVWFQVQNFMADIPKQIDSCCTRRCHSLVWTIPFRVHLLSVHTFYSMHMGMYEWVWDVQNTDALMVQIMLLPLLLLQLYPLHIDVEVNGLCMHWQRYFYRFIIPYASFWLISLWLDCCCCCFDSMWPLIHSIFFSFLFFCFSDCLFFHRFFSLSSSNSMGSFKWPM